MKGKIDIQKGDKKKLPIFCDFIFYHEMISTEIEDKLFDYSEIKEHMYGRENALRPISKILDMKNLLIELD